MITFILLVIIQFERLQGEATLPRSARGEYPRRREAQGCWVPLLPPAETSSRVYTQDEAPDMVLPRRRVSPVGWRPGPSPCRKSRPVCTRGTRSWAGCPSEAPRMPESPSRVYTRCEVSGICPLRRNVSPVGRASTPLPRQKVHPACTRGARFPTGDASGTRPKSGDGRVSRPPRPVPGGGRRDGGGSPM